MKKFVIFLILYFGTYSNALAQFAGPITANGIALSVRANLPTGGVNVGAVRLVTDTDGATCTAAGSVTLFCRWTGAAWVPAGSGDITTTGGDVFGPGSSTSGHVATFGNTTGKLIADAAIALSASGLTIPTATLAGRTTAATGAVEGITIGGGLNMAATVLSIPSSGVTAAMLAGSIPYTKLIGTDIITVGTITTGTWNATTIAFNKGGTGVASAADDGILVSSGSAWVVTILPDCPDSGGNHLNYTASSNAFSCGTLGSGGGGGGSGTPGGSGSAVQYRIDGSTFGGATGMSSPAGTYLLGASGGLRLADIKDTGGNPSLILTATASAVNGLTITNSATGNAVALAPSGLDTNIGLNLGGKGTGQLGLGGGFKIFFGVDALTVNRTATFQNSNGSIPWFSGTPVHGKCTEWSVSGGIYTLIASAEACGTGSGGGGGGDALVANPLSQFAATTSLQLKNTISDETGSGALVFATSPSLVTPVLGVASATTINKITITAPATGATLTIADGLTLNAGPGGTLGTSAFITLGTGVGTWLATPTSANLAAAITNEIGTGPLVFGTSPTLTTPTFDGLTKVTNANSASTALRVIDDASTNYGGMYWSASLGLQFNCFPAGVENDCNYIRHLNAGKIWGVSERADITVFSVTENNAKGIIKFTLGSDATGDTYYRNSSGEFVRLAKGTQYQTLQGGATTPGYAAVSLDQATAVTGLLPAANVVAAMTRRVCDIGVGDTSGSALSNAQLGPQKRVCFIPAAATIVEMVVAADAGTPNVIVAKNSAGSASNIVSSALATAGSGGIACSKTTAVTGLDGATTCSATLQNTSLAAGDFLELVSGTAGGTAKWMTIHVVYVIN